MCRRNAVPSDESSSWSQGWRVSTVGTAEGRGYRGFHAVGYGYNNGNHWPIVNRWVRNLKDYFVVKMGNIHR